MKKGYELKAFDVGFLTRGFCSGLEAFPKVCSNTAYRVLAKLGKRLYVHESKRQRERERESE